MATTTQVTSYRSAGQPDDGVGAVGDICWDTQNRITWVKQSNNSWVNGAYSNIGPTGPAQLSYNGVPPSGFGQIGNGATDLSTGLTYLKSSSGWTQVGSIVGPVGTKGDAGYTTLQQQSAGFGPSVGNASQTLSSAPTAIPYPGSSSAPYQFGFPFISSFLGANVANLGAAVTLELYDLTASKSIYSTSVSAGVLANYGVFAATAYPMTQGNSHVWRISGSGTAQIQITPYFLSPSAGTVNQSLVTGFLSAAATAWSGTTQYLGPWGSTTNINNSRQFKVIRAATLGYIQAAYVPSTAGAASANVTLTLYGYNGSATSTYATATSVLTNTGISQTVLAPAAGSVSMPTGVTYFIGVTGSGTGQVYADLSLVQ